MAGREERWCHDIGQEQAANKPLLKTVFQVMMRLFSPCKTTLLFVIRDKTKSPLEHLEPVLREDIRKVEVTTLPSYEEKEEQFREQVKLLRQRFLHLIAPGGHAGDRRGVIPASCFSFSAQQIWKIIRENRDLDLPAHKVAVATVRCEELANEKLSQSTANESWMELEEAVQSGPLSGFGRKLGSILDTYLSEYDEEAIYFDESVTTAKRRQLESRALHLVHPAFQSMLGHLRSRSLENFKNDMELSIKSGKGFASPVCSCTPSSINEFDQGCADIIITQADWDTSKVREKTCP